MTTHDVAPSAPDVNIDCWPSTNQPSSEVPPSVSAARGPISTMFAPSAPGAEAIQVGRVEPPKIEPPEDRRIRRLRESLDAKLDNAAAKAAELQGTSDLMFCDFDALALALYNAANGTTEEDELRAKHEAIDRVSANFGGATEQAAPDNGPHVRLQSGEDVEPRKIDWLWHGWLACGKFEILSGSKGVGKSTLKIERPRDFLVWSGEDDFADVILPRFLAAGGDPKRLKYVFDFKNGDMVRDFDPAFHTELLADAASAIPDLGMILIDPIVSAVRGDSHKNAEVRNGLRPLIALAAATRSVLIGITHFTKGTQGRSPTERINGSVAFGAAARVSLHAVKSEDEDAPRRFIMGDNNHEKSGGGFEYTLEQVPCPRYPDILAQRVIWGRRLHGSPRQLLDDLEQPDRPKPIAEQCAAWLVQTLRDRGGSMPVKEVEAAAHAHNYSPNALRDAREKVLKGQVETQETVGEKHGGWSLQLIAELAPAAQAPTTPWPVQLSDLI
jgi:putative DNA primase/helicase